MFFLNVPDDVTYGKSCDTKDIESLTKCSKILVVKKPAIFPDLNTTHSKSGLSSATSTTPTTMKRTTPRTTKRMTPKTTRPTTPKPNRTVLASLTTDLFKYYLACKATKTMQARIYLDYSSGLSVDADGFTYIKPAGSFTRSLTHLPMK